MAASVASRAIAPLHAWTPPRDSTHGDEVAGFVESLGVRLDPEQRLVLDAMYARRGGRHAALEVALVAPRQNHKTHTCEMACLADLFLFGGRDRLIIWTAHLFPTANEAFIDLKAMIDRHDFLSARVAKITEAAGNQGIELVDGTRLKFLARSKSGGRGFSGSKVYLDESFALTAAEVGSLMPTLSAQPDPQVVYASSAGRLDSAVLRALRDRGRRGGDESLAYLEWAAAPGACDDSECMHLPGSAGCVLDDRERWRQANTAVGRRIGEDFIAAERRSLPPTEFMRERLGWWEDPPEADGALDNGMPGWSMAVTERGAAAPFTVGVAVSADSRSGVVAVFGGGVVEVVDYRKGAGVGWLAARAREVAAKWNAPLVALAGSPTKQLAAELGDATVWVPSAEYPAACMGFARRINEGSLWHRGQAVLDIAAGNAVRGHTGDVWRWSLSKSVAERGTDVSPLQAAALAAHVGGADTTDRSTEALLSSFG